MRYAGILVIALGALLFGCGKKQETPVASQELRINISIEPTTLDPRKARTLNEVTLCRMLYEGLTRISKEGKTELATADTVTISEDRLEYVFHLRNAKWSNGEPVTAFDFAASWKAILNPQFPSDISYQLYTIENAKKVKTGELGSEALGVKTVDAHTLLVRLEQPTPYFLEICAMTSLFAVPEKIALENPQWAQDPSTFVGNGPFVLNSWTHNDELLVTKSASYWESAAVRLDKIELLMLSNDTEIRMFEDHKLDWAGSPLSTLPVDALKHLKSTNELKVNPLCGTYFFRVNTSETVKGKINPLSSPDFRKALAKGIDRDAIVTHILQGGQVAARSLVPPEMGLIEKGYFTELKDGRSLLPSVPTEPIVITFVSTDRAMSIAQAVQKQLQESLGIEVQLEAVESKIFSQRVKQKDFQLAIGDWIADFNDPINFLEVFKYKDGSTNNTNWENPKYIELLNQSAVCGDQDERKQILREAEEILMDQMPIIPIFHHAMNFLKRDGVKGIALSPIANIDFRWAEVDAQPSRSMR